MLKSMYDYEGQIPETKYDEVFGKKGGTPYFRH